MKWKVIYYAWNYSMECIAVCVVYIAKKCQFWWRWRSTIICRIWLRIIWYDAEYEMIAQSKICLVLLENTILSTGTNKYYYRKENNSFQYTRKGKDMHPRSFIQSIFAIFGVIRVWETWQNEIRDILQQLVSIKITQFHLALDHYLD